MADYIKLDEAPRLVVNYPSCSACEVDLECEDTWICPSCGTSWSMNDGDGDEGELYESWAGESLEGDVITHDIAWRVAGLRARADREAWLTRFLSNHAVPERKTNV